MKRVALYVRVSTEEQKKHGISVESQIAALTKYAEGQGYVVVDIYNDAGITARKKYTKRPALLRLLDDCKVGKIDLILFTKLDRWFRNVSAYYQVQEQLDAYHVPWKAIWEDYETITANGILKVNIMLSVAQSEADKGSERIKAVMQYKKDRGDFVGKAPYGYYLKNSKLYKNDSEKEGIQSFFNTYLSTFLISVSIQSAEAHGITIGHRRARYMLSNPIYMGKSGNVICEPYITEDQYNLIQVSLAGRRLKEPSKKSKRIYLFSGLCKCGECGRNMSVAVRVPTTRNPNKKEYYSYRCTQHEDTGRCPTGSMAEIKLEKYLLKEVEKEINDRYVDDYKIKEKNADVDKRIDALKKKMQRIGDRYEDGDITREEYRKKRDAIMSEIASIEKEKTTVSTTFVFPDGWKEMYFGLDREHKRAFWRTVLKEIRIYADRSIKLI